MLGSVVWEVRIGITHKRYWEGTNTITVFLLPVIQITNIFNTSRRNLQITYRHL